MGWFLAQPPKVIRRPNDAAPENMMPQPIDDDPRRKRVRGVQDVFGELAAPRLAIRIVAFIHTLPQEDIAYHPHCWRAR